ncbi:ACP S-malonyltransferase [Chloroflexota bacterium]
MGEAIVNKICQETNTQIANINCPGQLVISGSKDNLTQAANLAKSSGAYRTIELQVSGAFHTPLMQPAVVGMTNIVDTLTFNEPMFPIIANTTAQPLTTSEQLKAELLRQLCHNIRWQQSVEYMIDNSISTFIEIGPGRILSGLNKRINRNVKTINISDAKALEEFLSTD